MKCKLCDTTGKKIFSKKILGKYDTDYLKCDKCGFIQTTHNNWLHEAYTSAITSLDLGLLSRNIRLKWQITPIIDAFYPGAKNFLDFAGGYGVFVRIMRDEGFNYFRHDPHCENLFAKHFDHTDSGLAHFDLATAFEVFEHFDDPLAGIQEVFSYAGDLIFTTELYDNVEDLENWWYLAPETGQHIAFYSTRTLEYLAGRFNKKYYNKAGNIHIFSARSFSQTQLDYALRDIRQYKQFFGLLKRRLDFSKQRTSLLEPDFNYVRSLLQKQQLQENKK